MKSSAIIETLTTLKKTHSRDSYFIAKELLMIELNLTWKDDTEPSKLRLYSLARHVRDVLKRCPEAEQIALGLEKMADEAA